MAREKQRSDRHPELGDVEAVPLSRDTGGRTYYITIPIRPLSGDIPEEHLDRLTLYYTLYGVVFCVVGIIAIVVPRLFGVAIELLLAWLLILGGAVTLLQFVLICGAPGSTSFLLLGALHLAAGLWLILQPVAGTTALTFVVGAWFVGHGVFKLLMAIQVRNVTTWPALLVSGFVSIILAFTVVALTPRKGTKLIGLAFGGDLIFSGFALLLISLMAFLGKRHRSVTDAELVREPLLRGGGQAASSA